MVGLHNLKREYEERRRALVEQLRRNERLDSATQHQIYGAVKEIEHFLSAIDHQVETEQDLHIDLARERPRPIVERTRNAVGKVKNGTKKAFATAGRKVTSGPKSYLERRRKLRELKRQIEAELKSRQSWHYKEKMAPELPPVPERPPGGLSGTLSEVHPEPDTIDVDVTREEFDNPRGEEMGEARLTDPEIEEQLARVVEGLPPEPPMRTPARPLSRPMPAKKKRAPKRAKKSAKKSVKKGAKSVKKAAKKPAKKPAKRARKPSRKK